MPDAAVAELRDIGLAKDKAPAALNRSTQISSSSGTKPRYQGEPITVRMSLVATRSLMPIGRPRRNRVLARRNLGVDRACRRERYFWRRGAKCMDMRSSVSMRRSAAFATSVADSFLDLTMRRDRDCVGATDFVVGIQDSSLRQDDRRRRGLITVRSSGMTRLQISALSRSGCKSGRCADQDRWARRVAIKARPGHASAGRVRNGANERGRVGMAGVGEERLGRADFDDLPQIHHRNARTEKSHDIEVVRHEKVAHPEPLSQLGQQLQHHRLDRNVERGSRFVENEQRGLDDNRAGDADTRPLTAGKLMRVALEKLCRQTDKLRRAPNARIDVPGVAKTKETSQRIRNSTEDAEGWIEALGRIWNTT